MAYVALKAPIRNPAFPFRVELIVNHGINGVSSMKILENILEGVGNTPLIKLHKLVVPGGPAIYVKAEYLNPGGSVKDRMALYIIEKAEREGLLKPGGTIVENTSGNTGVGVALVAAVKGYKAIFTMPDKMSSEKVELLKALGARVVITPTDVPPDSPQSYYETAKRIAAETPNSFYLNQYHNPDNIETHYMLTGPEIYEQTDGKITHLVAGAGTGGTISGVGKYLKEKNPNIKIIGVDPVGSVFYNYFKERKLIKPHVYKVEGIGEDMLVGAMDFSVIDDMIQVTDQECFLTARDLARKEGIFAGGSSGGAVFAALKVARDAKPDDVIVTILPDAGDRYLSKFYNDAWMADNGFFPYETLPGQIAELISGEHLPPITIDAEKPIRDAISLMKKYDISQLPVKDGAEVIGMVYEIDLLRALAARTGGLDDPVRDVAERQISRVGPEEPISRLAEIFTEKGEAVLVMRDNELVGVLTKIDLITYLARSK
jgi:cystathionine beta-synthase